MLSQITRLAFWGSGSLESTPGEAMAAGPSNEASATPPTPWAVLPRKVRRVSAARSSGGNISRGSGFRADSGQRG